MELFANDDLIVDIWLLTFLLSLLLQLVAAHLAARVLDTSCPCKHRRKP